MSDGGRRGGRGWYVYCVVAAGEALPLDGVGGIAGVAGLAGVDPEAGPIGTVTEGEVRAVVSPVRLAEFAGDALQRHLDDLVWLSRTARAHDAVIREVHAHATVVPLRLCTIFTDRSRVAGMLRRAQARLVDDLWRLRGRSEWSVKVLAAPAQVAAVVAHEATLAGAGAGAASGRGPGTGGGAGDGGGEGRAYLARKRHQRRGADSVRARMEATAAEVHDRLRELATDTAVLRPQRPEMSARPGQMVLNAAYLVDQGQAAALAAAAGALRDAHGPAGFDVELTGPWAPYNFVTSGEPDT